MGKTKEVSIPEEYMELCKTEFEIDLPSSKVVIKRFLRGDITRIQQECIKIKATSTSNNISADVNSADYRDLSVVKAIVEAPWALEDLNAIRELPPFLVDWLEKEIKEFNTIEIKKKEE